MLLDLGVDLKCKIFIPEGLCVNSLECVVCDRLCGRGFLWGFERIVPLVLVSYVGFGMLRIRGGKKFRAVGCLAFSGHFDFASHKA